MNTNKCRLLAAYRVDARYICDNDFSPYKFINRLFSYQSITNDRWGWLTQFSNIDWQPLDEKPTSLNQNIDIFDAIDARAVDVLKTASSREIIVSWSGGVDSCCIVSSLLRNNKNNKISILLTQHSIEENPDFYYKLVDNGIHSYIVQSDHFFDQLYKRDDYIFVHGHCCDELFHSNLPSCMTIRDLASDWTDGVKTYMYRNFKMPPHIIDNYSLNFDIIRCYTDTVLDKPIRTFADFMWFWRYVGRYESTRRVVTLEAENQYLRDNNIAFFDTRAFNLWALQSFWFDSKHNPSHSSYYKTPLKQYIRSAVNDSSCDNLVKRCSYNHVVDYNQSQLNFHILTTNGVEKIPVRSQKEKFEYIKRRFRKFERPV